MVSDTHFFRLDAKSLQPVDTELFPVCEPFEVSVGLTEEFQLHLLKLSGTEREVAGCDFIPEGLTDLTDTKRDFLSGSTLYVLEVYENTLCGFGTQIYRILCILRNTLEGLEHQVELTDLGKVMLAAGRAGNLIIFDKLHHLFLTPAVYRASQINIVLLRIIFDDLICTETLVAFLTVHQRIGKAAQMAAGHPCLRVHENGAVNTQRTTRRKLPFGVCQVGKAFRNEITPGNFTFRTREFEQMECEFFCKPGTDLKWFSYWKDYCENWLLSLGIKKEHLRLRDHEPAELAFYSRATTDIEYAFPFTDWGELWGIADRTNYDLTRHQEASGKSLEYFDSETNEHYIPYVIEPSLGCDRVALAFLCEAYDEEHLTDSKGKEDIRTVLHLHPALAPYKCAVLPLSKKLGDKAMEIRNELSKYFMVDYDDTGSIGKRYRRQDEIGTPYCITVDFDTVGDEAKGIAADNCVTVRDRDTMEQVRMPISELKSYIESKIEF